MVKKSKLDRLLDRLEKWGLVETDYVFPEMKYWQRIRKEATNIQEDNFALSTRLDNVEFIKNEYYKTLEDISKWYRKNAYEDEVDWEKLAGVLGE